MTSRQWFDAVSTGDCEKARQLILHSKSHNFDIAPRGQPSDRIPLRIACERGDIEMVKILIKNGADTNLISRFSRALGKDGVIMSCASYDPQILSFVFDELEGDITVTPLCYACDLKNLEFARFLISKNCPVNGQDGRLISRTPLLAACMSKEVEMVELLLQNGAQTTVKDRSILYEVCYCRCFELIQTLVDYGANVNEFCNGATPLILLSRAGSVVNQLETVEFLLKRGANIALTDLHGQTCLHAAALKGNLLLVKFLCEYGADPDAKDSQVVCRVFLIGNSVGVKFLRKVIREGLQLKKFLEEFVLIDSSIKPAKRGEEEEGTKKRKNSQNGSVQSEMIANKKPRLDVS